MRSSVTIWDRSMNGSTSLRLLFTPTHWLWRMVATWGKGRLLRLLGSASRADGAVNSAREELGRLRTVRVSRVISSGSAEFFLLFAPGPKVESVRFISGSEGLRPATKTLAAAAYKVPFP